VREIKHAGDNARYSNSAPSKGFHRALMTKRVDLGVVKAYALHPKFIPQVQVLLKGLCVGA
jgi:hypothetical protein